MKLRKILKSMFNNYCKTFKCGEVIVSAL
ncbi:stress response protein AzuC [Escherichia coli]|nr:stress response protein AzuC [Escherichia coli]